MSSRAYAVRIQRRATATHRAAQPGTPEFKAAGSLAAALFLTRDTERARDLITRNHATAPDIRAAALDLLNQFINQEGITS